MQGPTHSLCFVLATSKQVVSIDNKSLQLTTRFPQVITSYLQHNCYQCYCQVVILYPLLQLEKIDPPSETMNEKCYVERNRK